MEPQLAAYIDRGDVRLIHYHRIIKGADSFRAAEATECAGEQGKFWAMRSRLFENAQGGFSAARLKSLARGLGMDERSFAACLDSGRHAARVKQQDQEAQQAGVDATPFFIIGQRPVRGLPPVEALLALVDEELKRQ